MVGAWRAADSCAFCKLEFIADRIAGFVEGSIGAAGCGGGAWMRLHPQLHHGCARSAFILRRLSDGCHVRVRLQVLSESFS
jgi:hypothetical protein